MVFGKSLIVGQELQTFSWIGHFETFSATKMLEG